MNILSKSGKTKLISLFKGLFHDFFSLLKKYVYCGLVANTICEYVHSFTFH